MIRSWGSGSPTSLVKVGRMSIVVAISRHTEPEGIRPGHRIIQGIRIPPSNVVPLPSLRGPADPACVLATNFRGDPPPEADLGIHFSNVDPGKPYIESEGSPKRVEGGYWGPRGQKTARNRPLAARLNSPQSGIGRFLAPHNRATFGCFLY